MQQEIAKRREILWYIVHIWEIRKAILHSDSPISLIPFLTWGQQDYAGKDGIVRCLVGKTGSKHNIALGVCDSTDGSAYCAGVWLVVYCYER